MNNNTTPLQERIARALYENAEYYGPEDAQPPWDSRDDEERGEWMEIAAAVLPIIAAEAQAASEKAWDEGYEAGMLDTYRLGRDMDLTITPAPNPYRASENE